MPRLDPITTQSDLSPDHQRAADAVVSVFGHVRGPFSMLLHSPGLAERLLPMVTFVRRDTIVEPDLRFAAILAAARESKSEYVWAAQVEQAHKNGIRRELIDLVRAEADTERFAGEDGTVVRYVRQLLRDKRVDQATFDALRTKHGDQWLVELTATANFFAFVSGICNAFEVPAPQGGDRIAG